MKRGEFLDNQEFFSVKLIAIITTELKKKKKKEQTKLSNNERAFFSIFPVVFELTQQKRGSI